MPRDHLAHCGPYSVSFSELSTFASCEARWFQNYVLRKEGGPSKAMQFGTLMHSMIEGWWESGDVSSPGAHARLEELDLNDDGKHSLDDATWLFDRYVELYRPWKVRGWHVDPIRLVEQTLDAVLQVPGVGPVRIYGTPDGFLIDPDGKRWLVERKTMADWRRLDIVDVTPQETLYVWLARENGIEIEGVLFDAIKTYRWTRDAHPAADSFQLLTLYRDDDQIEGALGWARSILQRRSEIYPGVWKTLFTRPEPIKNIGQQTCGNCSYQSDCWNALAFPHDIDVMEEA